MAGNTAALIIPGTIANPAGLLKDWDDERLTVGSLALLDPTHPANPSSGYINATSGVSANGDLFYNVAYKAAIAAGIAGTASTLAGTHNVGAAFTGSGTLRERSAKGGNHVVAPQPGTFLANRYVSVTLADLIRIYLVANLTHKYYVSLWYNITRTAVTGQGFAPHSTFGASTSAGLWYMGSRPSGDGGETQYPTAARAFNRRSPATANSTGVHNDTAEYDGSVSTAPTTATPLNAFSVGDNYGSGLPGKSMSAIFYGFYLEDLTLSGRTFAQVDALDSTAYTREVLTSGGRYFGDTYTAPSSVA